MMFSLLLLAAMPAPGFQSTVALDALVAQFTGKAIGEDGGAQSVVDARLKLAACPAPQLEWRGPAQDAVVVRCMAPAWRIFVPVKMTPRPVAPVPEIAAVAPRPVRAEPVIRRGDPITVEAGNAGFSITREGVAMGDAAPGVRLLVRVDEKKPPIQAVAIEPGRARLPGFD